MFVCVRNSNYILISRNYSKKEFCDEKENSLTFYSFFAKRKGELKVFASLSTELPSEGDILNKSHSAGLPVLTNISPIHKYMF